MGLHKGVDFFSDLAFVKALAAVFGDGSQGAGVMGQADDVAGLGRLAVFRKGSPKAVVDRIGIGLSFSKLHGPKARHGRGEDEAFLGVSNGGCQHLFKGQAAVFLVNVRPGPHGSRHAHGFDAVKGHGLVASLLDGGEGNSGGAFAAAVVAVKLASRGNNGEEIASQAVGGGLYHRLGRRHGDGAVHGIAAGF